MLPDYAPRATVYLNTSGVRMLDGDPDIDNVFVDVTPLAGTWIRPRDADGNELEALFEKSITLRNTQ